MHSYREEGIYNSFLEGKSEHQKIFLNWSNLTLDQLNNVHDNHSLTNQHFLQYLKRDYILNARFFFEHLKMFNSETIYPNTFFPP